MNEKDFPYYLPPRIKEKFIGRSKDLEIISNNFKNDNTQIICSFSGVGKSTLALEYAYKLKDEEKCIPRWFNSNLKKQIEIEYKEFADVLDVKTESKSMKFISQKVNFLLEKSNSNILFIFDDLDDYDSIEEIIAGLPKNVKVLITSKNQILNCFVKKIEVNLFNIDEAKLYLDLNLKSINEEEKDQLINTVKTKTNQILPLKLNRLVHYFKEFPLFTFNKMIQNSVQLNFPNIQAIFFDRLVNQSHEAFRVLHLCSFLKFDFVTFSFLFNLTRNHFNKDMSEFKLHHLLNILNRFSFIKSTRINNKECFSITHSFIQEEIQIYADKIKSNVNSAIVDEIAEFLVDSIDKTQVNSTIRTRNEDVYKQASHLIEYLETGGIKHLMNKFLHIKLVEKMSYFELLINNDIQNCVAYNLKCLQLRKETLVENHPDIIKTINNIAVGFHIKGEYFSSLNYFLKIYEILSKQKNISIDLADCLNNLGQLYYDLGDYKKSLDYNKKAYEMKEQLLDINEINDARNLAKSQCQLAISYRSLGNYKMAIQFFLKSFEILLNLFNQHSEIDASMDLANSLSNLGKLFHDLGDYKKSLDYNYKSHEIKRKLCEINMPLIADSLSDTLDSIATSYNSLGEYGKALEYFFKSLDLKNKFFKGNHPEKANSLDSIGVVYHNLGRYEESLEFCLNAYEMRRLIYEPNHPCLAISLQNIGVAYRNIGDQKNLLDYFINAYEISENLMNSNLYFDLNSSLGEKSFEKEDVDLTKSYSFNHSTPFDSLEDCNKLIKKEFKEKNLKNELRNFKNLNSSQKDYKLSLEYFIECYKIREKIYNCDCHLDIAESLDNIATSYNCLGEFQKALEYYRKSLKIKKNLFDQKHPDIGTSYISIAIVYSNLENYKNSMKYFLKSFKLKNRLKDNRNSSDLRQIFRNVNLIYRSLDDNQKALMSRLSSFKKLNKYFNNFNFINQTNFSVSSLDSIVDDQIDANKTLPKNNDSINLIKLFEKIEKSQNFLNDFNNNVVVTEN
jgi:tetratricopeptide (TPR) repeat protein